VEGEEVRALRALHVENLDVLARVHLVAARGRRIDAEVQAWLGQRRRELELRARPRARAPLISISKLRRRALSALHYPPPRAPRDERRLAPGHERQRRFPGADSMPNSLNGVGRMRVKAARVQRGEEAVIVPTSLAARSRERSARAAERCRGFL